MFEFASRSDSALDSEREADLRSIFRQSLPAWDWASADRQVMVALIDLREWRPWLTQASALLDPAESARVQRRRRSADREALALAYALHRLLLAAALGRNPSEVPLYRDERGCPRLGDGSLQTSLSHADDFAAVALSAAGPVGVDIEPSSRAPTLSEIAASICHPSEAAALAGLAEPAYGEALLALWVRKEALLKAAGVGLAREMNGFPAPEREWLPLSPLDSEGTRLRMLDAGPACLAAVAGPPETPVASAWLRPCEIAAGHYRARSSAI